MLITRSIFGAALVLLSTASLACAHATRACVDPAPGRPHVRVMTYNVNFALAGDPPGIDAIRAGGADVVFLQETTPQWAAALHQAFDVNYPEMGFAHAPGAGGLGVLSRLAIV